MSPKEEEQVIRVWSEWLDCVYDLVCLTTDTMWNKSTADREIPSWVRRAAHRLANTQLFPATKALDELKLTPFRVGYAFGIMGWGEKRTICEFVAAEKKLTVKRKLSPKTKKNLMRVFENFFLRSGLMNRNELRRSEFIPRNLKNYISKLDRETTERIAEFHRGASDGYRGLGINAPNDRSNLASDVYLALVICWRGVARMESVTELHVWLCRILGPQKVGERDRVRKICQRIGLKFRERGRPRTNGTPPPPG